MDLIADMMLGAAAFAAAVYCIVLSRRLSRFTQLETGMGGAIAVLSAQVDDLTRVLEQAQLTARQSAGSLDDLTRRAGASAARLELLMASLHDLPAVGAGSKRPGAPDQHRTQASDAQQPSQHALVGIRSGHSASEAEGGPELFGDGTDTSGGHPDVGAGLGRRFRVLRRRTRSGVAPEAAPGAMLHDWVGGALSGASLAEGIA